MFNAADKVDIIDVVNRHEAHENSLQQVAETHSSLPTRIVTLLHDLLL